jgi:hypothetical protein
MTRLLILAALLLAAPLSAQTLRADSVAVGGSGMGGPTGPYTLYSLAENRVVSNADSASTGWDLALLGTTMIFNGGTSGPGQGAARLVDLAFEDVTGADATDLLADGEGDCPRGGPLAVCTGSGNGWYLYAGNGVEPIATRTLVVRLADGEGLAKLRVLSYVLSDPLPDGSRPRFYSFEYERLDSAASASR